MDERRRDSRSGALSCESRSGVALRVLTALTGPPVAISWVKDYPVPLSLSLLAVSQAHLPSSVCQRGPCETSRLGNVYSHAEPQEASRGKCSLCLHLPPRSPFPCAAPLPAADGGPESLRKVGGEAEESADDSRMD